MGIDEEVRVLGLGDKDPGYWGVRCGEVGIWAPRSPGEVGVRDVGTDGGERGTLGMTTGEAGTWVPERSWGGRGPGSGDG